MGITWNDDQKKVISHRDGSLLVSAAAGSGKTAVMIERLVRLVTDPVDPVDVDELLVVTFTNAAAAQMRDKLKSALEARLENAEDESEIHRLMVQLQKLKNAEVETLHSFCLQCVRDYITRIPGLDPGFRIADETEARLIKADVLEEVLEECYLQAAEEPDDPASRYFTAFLDSYGGTRQDTGIEKQLLKMNDFLDALVDPEQWLERSAEAYRTTADTIESSAWYRAMKEEKVHLRRRALYYYQKVYESSLNIEPSGTHRIQLRLAEIIHNLTDPDSEDILISRMDYKLWKDPADNAEVRAWYDSAKKFAKRSSELEQLWMPAGKEAEARLMRERVYPALMGLRQTVLRFREAYVQEKKDRGVVDFQDLERYTLSVLKDPEGRPTPEARELTERFRYICIDEYQDSNDVQEEILRVICRKNEEGQPVNLFMVGDVKQSIYKFRQARPELFLEKMKSFPEQKDAELVLLHQNFRSRREILDGVNDIFYRLMTEEDAQIEYTEKEALVPGLPFPETEDPLILGGLPELTLLTGAGSLKGEQTMDAEADWIAGRIKTLIMSGAKICDENGATRLLRYQDIAVLLRSAKDMAPRLQQAMKRYEIPSYSEITMGFYQTEEIQCVINLLRIIDNPLQDIPLAGALYSPIFNYSAHELSLIRRLSGRKELLYDSMVAFSLREPGDKEEQELKAKVDVFLSMLGRWRERVKYLPVHTLLWEILEETGYYVYAAGTPEGRQKSANLDLLLQYALTFEQGSYSGLFHFLRYLEKMEEQERDEVQARILGEEDNVVRIMTIHKSKGLEFPVVFVCRLGHGFNLMDLNERILYHPELGLGADAMDEEQDFRFDTLAKLSLRAVKEKEMLAEELRVLYVALTRAQLKLFLVGFKDDPRWERGADLFDAKCYLDWILPLMDEMDSWHMDITEVIIAEADVIPSAQEEETSPADQAIYKEIDRRMQWKYPYTWRSRLPSRLSVSQLKKDGEDVWEKDLLEEEPPGDPLNETVRVYEAGGSDAGTAIHKVLSLLDLKDLESGKAIAAQLDRLEQRGYLSPQERSLVSLRQLELFARSSLLRRMNASSKLLKEQPFIVEIPISKVREWIPGWMESLPEEASEERIMVQGIIDGCFLEDGSWVLLDYKSDRVLDERRITMYRRQLELYRYALNTITGRPVKEMLLYATRTGKEIVL